MTQYEIAALYIGLNVFLFIALKLNAGRVRTGEKVDFGQGDSDKMARAMRVQGNAVEDTPITLLGIFALASLAAPTALIHALGGTLTVSRVLHAIGLGGSGGASFGRLVGTLGTLITMLVTAGACIYYAAF